MPLITTPTQYTLEIREIENTGTNTEELSLQNTKDNKKETTPSNIQTDDSEGRSKLCTRVLNETTLRIFCQRKSNTETFTHEFDIPITSPFISTTSPTVEDKEDKKATETQHLKEKTTQQG